MPLIPIKEQIHIKDLFFKKLKEEVKIINFTQEFECGYCRETRELLQELSQLSEKLKLEIYDFVKDSDMVKKFDIDKIPAIVLSEDYKIRFFGLPAGYEFGVLLEDIVDISQKTTRLSSLTKQRLKEINKPLHIQVFVTPTCPYCPRAARLAHQFAIENKLIKADVVEVTEFPYLANKYNVMAVPKIVINDQISFEGALPESHFLEHLFKG
ncbi:NADH dehydrogenase [archaeon HR06]|nr:NADH dehydrogenase [archaeon HR06]